MDLNETINGAMGSKTRVKIPTFQGRNRNPFVTGAAVRGEDFHGREETILKIKSFLVNKSDISMLIFGQRRIGKTSLLRMIEKDALQWDLAVPVYFNLQDKAYTTLPQLLFDIAHKIDFQLTLELALKKESFTGSGANGSEFFHKEFIPLVNGKLASSPPLLLLFDETDVMVPVKGDEDITGNDDPASKTFIPFLSGMFEKTRIPEPPLKLILAVGRQYKNLEQMQFGQLTKFGPTVEISYFTKEETTQLINNYPETQLPFDQDAIKGIYALTSGHPYFTQCLARASYDDAVKSKQERITLDLVNRQVIPAIKRYGSGVYSIWDSLPANDRRVLYLMAIIKEENKPVNLETIRQKALDCNLSEVVQNLPLSIKRMKSYYYIKETPGNKGQYDFCVEFIRRWIVKEVSVTDIR